MDRVISAHRDTSRTGRAALSDLARRKLEQHPHFRGRMSDLEIEQRGATLCLSGQLPSFYLKQLVQEALLSLPGIREIDNAIDVINPAGVSSVRRREDRWVAAMS
jgi:hypothetical protein